MANRTYKKKEPAKKEIKHNICDDCINCEWIDRYSN